MPSQEEIKRRYENIRRAMAKTGVDALLVCGNQYAGFEGAIRYVSGFEIVHRCAYVLIPLEGEPTLIFPAEARWVGDKKKPWIRDHVWADVPGAWVRDRVDANGWKRLAVYGLEHVLAVRDYRELEQANCALVAFDFEFDMARAVKSEEELVEVRDSIQIIEEGFWTLVKAFRPGLTEAEIMGPAVGRFFAGGGGTRMMNIVLSGTGGEAEPHFKVPGHRRVGPDDLVFYSLEITGSEGYWVEFSRPLIEGRVSARTQRMMNCYPEALSAAQQTMRDGVRASNVHRAAADIFLRNGFGLGHLSGHSIGLTMLEYPAIGANVDVLLRENMIFSFHPQVIDQNGEACLYTQDMYRIGKQGGELLTPVPWKLYRGEEKPGHP